MKAIRRSFKSDKEEKAASRHAPHPSLHAKSATAIIPPKKVIKALYDYEPTNKNGHELAFHKGDFFHVLSREDDTEWYEACNPLIPSARGLVPVAFFEAIGKNQRQSDNSARSSADGALSAPHDSGFSEKGSIPTPLRDDKPPNMIGAPRTTMHSRAGSTSRTNAMVYGIVQYDFQAERPDELEAKVGEPIIVVAQSNPEWFVAKPIGRLGGPGLIPVSFVSIKDTVTGEAVTDPLEAVRAAGVPKVEEWKKTAAEYKNSSISLGQINTPQVAQATAGLDRMSLNHKQQQLPQPPQTHQQHSNHKYDQPQQQTPLAPVSASVPRYCFDNDMYWYIIEAQMEDGRWWELSRYYADFYDFQIALLEAFPEEAGNRGRPRTLPFMPGPVAHVTDAISNGRRQNLDEYIKKIVSMPPHISKSALVKKLFAPKPGQDYEIDPSALGEDYRLSADGQSLAPTQSRQSEAGSGYTKSAHSGHQQRPSYGQNPPLNGTSNNMPPPPLHTQASTLTQNSTGSASARGPTPNPTGPGQSQLKFKVHFAGDLIAMRVPGDSNFQAIKERIMERLRIEQDIRMKWETGQNMQEVKTDQDLDNCLSVNANPKFFVEYAT